VPYGGVSRQDLGDGIGLYPFEKSAVILYRIAEDAVEIVSIFYGGRDYDAIFIESERP
jgi:toxin ParE1/3/4